jgi:hypothetical protein
MKFRSALLCACMLVVPAVAIGRDDGLKVNVAVNAVLVGAKVMNPTYELKIRVPLVAFRAD